MSNSTNQRLVLGNVNFFHFEVPETLPNLFGVQKYAVHDFPGGGMDSRTVQELGAFPFPEIEWRGEFWDNDPQPGTSAVERASTLNTYRVTGEKQTLVWGPFQYDVVVCEFEVLGMLKQRLGYRIKVIPINDFTTTSNIAAPSVAPAIQVQNATQAVQNATNTPSAGYIFSPSITSQSASIVSNVNNAVTQANGNIAAIPPSTVTSINSQIGNLQSSLSSLMSGNDYSAAAAANTLSGNLSILSGAIGTAPPDVATITVNNPNLASLASQYYGDPSLWPLIAQQNNLQDMQLTGTYQLIIPSSTTQSAFIV